MSDAVGSLADLSAQRESDRLDLQHHLFYLTFGGKLHLAPIERPRNAVDIGTGTGIWAVDFGMVCCVLCAVCCMLHAACCWR